MQTEEQDKELLGPEYAAARQRRLHQVLIVLLGVITLAVYLNSFGEGFSMDNRPLVSENSRVKAVTKTNLTLIFTQDYWHPFTSGLYRPVTTLTYLLNYAVAGGGPAGYHAANVFLQWLNATLAYLLAYRLFRAHGLAFATAALWTVHPLLTEAITNIIGRADLLAGAALLGGLLCYIRAMEAHDRRIRIRWIIALAIVTGAGIFSKENVVVLPVLMAAYQLLFRKERGWRVFISPAYGAVCAPLLLCWWVRSRVLGLHLHPFVDNPLIGADFLTSRLTAIKVLGRYFWLFACPRNLSPDYSYNQVPLLSWNFDNWEDWQAIVAGLACFALLCVTFLCYRRYRGLCFFLVLSVTALIPVSNLVVPIGTIMAERFMYLPALGFSAFLAAGISWAGRRLGTPALAPLAVAIVCVLFGWRTIARNADWRDERTLMTKAVMTSPASFKTHMGLAITRAGDDRAVIEGDIQEIERSIQILSALPDSKQVAKAYATAGNLYRRKGELLDAAAPGSGTAWYQKARDILLHGEAIDRLADRAHAEAWLRRGGSPSRIAPYGIADVYLELGITYTHLNEPRRAVQALQYGLKLNIEKAQFYGLLANAYGALQEPENQIVTVLEGAILLPNERHLSGMLPHLYAGMDTAGCRPVTQDAIDGRIHMNLDCPIVQQQVCKARENLARRMMEMRLEKYAKRQALEAVRDMHCPPEQFGFVVIDGIGN